jgi:CRISPR type IV-associated protein Csf3
MDRFSLTVGLKTPFVTGGGYLTLDALLAGILFDETGDVDLSHARIPLKNTDGVWHGSAAIFEKHSVGKQVFVANLRAMHDLDIELVARNAQGKTHKALGLARRRDFGAVLNAYRLISASEITWYGEGDIKAVEALISSISFIGKRRASGYGEIDSFHIEDSELDGILGYLNEPLRPIPQQLYQGDRNALRADAAWRPAYWHPDNRAICYVPDSES